MKTQQEKSDAAERKRLAADMASQEWPLLQLHTQVQQGCKEMSLSKPIPRKLFRTSTISARPPLPLLTMPIAQAPASVISQSTRLRSSASRCCGSWPLVLISSSG